jgi:uncharacterized protein (DUF302 family)
MSAANASTTPSIAADAVFGKASCVIGTSPQPVLEFEPHIGLVLLCNVVVQEDTRGVLVSILDPMAMFTLVYNPAVAPVAEEAASRLRRVLDAIG